MLPLRLAWLPCTKLPIPPPLVQFACIHQFNLCTLSASCTITIVFSLNRASCPALSHPLSRARRSTAVGTNLGSPSLSCTCCVIMLYYTTELPHTLNPVLTFVRSCVRPEKFDSSTHPLRDLLKPCSSCRRVPVMFQGPRHSSAAREILNLSVDTSQRDVDLEVTEPATPSLQGEMSWILVQQIAGDLRDTIQLTLVASIDLRRWIIAGQGSTVRLLDDESPLSCHYAVWSYIPRYGSRFAAP
ncbi:unnamed protein product [Peniophora sp. CBMAI 1063]|nr:unnamed protein product [Peniophora sp. CBMAI 1063]